MDSINDQKQTIKKKPKYRWLRNTILFVFLFPLFIFLLLQLPFVQKWVVSSTTAYLSQKMEANVTLQKVDFSIFEGIKLGGFSLVELSGDSVLYAKSLNVSLSRNLFSLLDNTLEIKEITLENPKLNLVLSSKDQKINLLRLIEKLMSKDSTSKKSSFHLNVKKVNLRQLDFKLQNELANTKILLTVEEGILHFNRLDINNNIFDIKTLDFIRPHIDIIKMGPPITVVNSNANEDRNPPGTLCISIQNFSVKDGVFNNQDGLQYTRNKPYRFDNANIRYEDIDATIHDLQYGGTQDIHASIDNITLKTDSGFNLKQFSIPHLIVNHENISLDNFLIETDQSLIKEKVVLSYSDMSGLKDFYNRVLIDAKLVDTKIALSEVAYFVPSFMQSPIYKNNTKEIVRLDGILKGRLNNLKGNNLTLKLGNKVDFEGDFGIRNILDKTEAIANLRIKKLKTNINFLKEAIPNFNPPANFFTLGNIDFVGNFDGYLNDFVAYGKLVTEIGKADLDMRLDVKQGNDKAKYSGNISLSEFDLHKWSGGNADLGKISLEAKIREGESLILKSAKADLTASIGLFQFRGYNYKDIKLNGKISPKEFLGNLESKDPNIDLTFDGSVMFNEAIPKFNFKSKINNIALDKLNLGKAYSSVKGEIEFEGEGNNINNLVGKLTGKNITVVKSDTLYKFDRVAFVTKELDKSGNKQLSFDSENVDVYLEGKYNFNTIADDIKSLVKTNYPYHTRSWNTAVKDLSPDQRFKFDIEVANAKDIFGLLDLKNVELQNFKSKGFIDSKAKELSLASSVPSLAINGTKILNLQLILNNKSTVGDLLVHVDSVYTGSQKISPIDMQFLMNGDNINFSLDSKNFMDSIQNISVKGTLVPHPKGYTIAILNNDLRLFKKRWKINNESKISIGSKYIDLENFVITDGERQIELFDINNKGLTLKANKIDLASINPFLNYPKILFGGELNAVIRVNDIYNPSPSLTGSINIPAIFLNNDGFGEVTIDLAKAENRPLEALISINNKADGQSVKINGLYDLESKIVNADIKTRKFSLKWLEYILKSGISNVKGSIDMEGKITGPIKNLTIDANAVANGGAVKVNYLGETYYFDNQAFKVTQNKINLNGARLKDSQGNVGVVFGGLNHNMFKQFSLDASIIGTNVIAVNTTKYDNAIYYGFGKGDVTVDFSGSVDAPKMIINVVTRPGTKINIPIKESRSSSDKNFIHFVEKSKYYQNNTDSTITDTGVKVEGISIEMNLTMTEDAIVNLIFDEYKNDIIRGVGSGNLKISMSNKGEFDMFGSYSISRGQYLFTAFNFVNKPFVVREGGIIRWTGDPINATINIEADYSVRTSLTNFLPEYLTTDQLRQAAAATTPVNLKLLLSNTLYNPLVKFDFEFPVLTGELKSYTDSKIRLLRNNEADYNSQAFGLIVFNTFIPSNTISQVVTNNNFIQNAGINTLSEFVSSQFSMYVTSLVYSALEDNGLISGIDFDLDLRNNNSFQGTGLADPAAGNQSTVWPTEIEVRLKNRFRFLDERLSVNVGGNYVRQNSLLTSLNNYVIPEFFIEYALTKDKQLNLKLYGKYDLDEINFYNRRQKFGIGIRYKNEFGSLRETQIKISEAVAKILSGKG